jgi:hypothetical protein
VADEAIPTATYTAMQTMTRRILEGQGSAISEAITYRQQTAETYDPEAATPSAPTVTNTAMTATRHTLTSDGNQPDEAGMINFLIEKRRLDDASVTTPSTADRIVDEASVAYEVMAWSLDGARLFWSIKCRRVG